MQTDDVPVGGRRVDYYPVPGEKHGSGDLTVMMNQTYL